jgi:tRNA A-37 threonylcarbamoyl transferase component Bud32
MAISCISTEQMARFLSGELPADDESVVTAHLQACASCDRIARSMSEAPVAQEMRVAAADAEGAPAQESLAELKGRLRALAYIGASDDAVPDGGSRQTLTGGDTERSIAQAPVAPLARRLGKFEVINEVGAGGFGIVYLARDTILERNVALKLPRASLLADPDARRRFYREAQSLARLDHHHILPVYEAGEADGTCYLAVAYCDGPTLESWLRECSAPIEPALAAQIVHALATAAQHAHEHGILHRDIKPANVLLNPSPSTPGFPFTPRLADFGLAKIADENAPGTVSGMVLGTPQYLAPEQAAGLTDRIGPWTDVYGLGTVLYELLTGRPPIRGSTNIDTLRRVLTDEPIPPSKLNSAAPAGLDAIVKKCLAKSTTSRYQTARDMAEELEPFFGRDSVTSVATVAVARAKRRSAIAWAAAGSMLLVLCAIAAVLVANRPHAPEESLSLPAEIAARAEADGAMPAEVLAQDEPIDRGETTANVETSQDLTAALQALPSFSGQAAHVMVRDRVGSRLMIDALDSGWWGAAAGNHRAGTKNYLVSRNNHNYFVFDLRAAQQHKIIAAELHLEVPKKNGYNSSDPHEIYALYDVLTPLVEIQGTAQGRSDIFHDLGSGAILGKQEFFDNDEGQVKSIPVNEAGIEALNAADGNLFAFGGALTTVDSSGGALFANSDFSMTKQLVVTLAAPTTKTYLLSLESGEHVSVDLRPRGGDATVEIRDSAGNKLACSVPSNNRNQRIDVFTAQQTGTYSIAVIASHRTDYELTVARGAHLENEPNDAKESAQLLSIGDSLVGTLAAPPIVPSKHINAYREGSNCYPFHLAKVEVPNMRYQQLYSAAEFPQPGTITAIRFRRHSSEPPFSTTGIDCKFNLSYAATTVSRPSLIFANNIGPGAKTVLDTANLSLSSTSTLTPPPMEIEIRLMEPFYYDPNQGDLLMDLFTRNAPFTTRIASSGRADPMVMRRIYAPDVNATSGSTGANFMGLLITQFEMAPDEDWYSLSLSGDEGRMRLAVTTVANRTDDDVEALFPHLEVFDPSGAMIVSDLSSPDDHSCQVTFQPPAAGTYRVRVTGQNDSTGSYLLNSSRESD